MLKTEKIIELAKQVATPMYLFDIDTLRDRVRTMQEILGKEINICYAMKANPFLVDALRNTVSKYEVCSPGEFAICEREHIDMSGIVLSGVNKEKADVIHVIKDCGSVGMYTIESETQLNLLEECAGELNAQLPVLVRVTSGNQFGVDEQVVERIIRDRASYPHLTFEGVQAYTGTQKKKLSQIEEELAWLDGLCDRLNSQYGWQAQELEYGPGLLTEYFGENAFLDGMEDLKAFSEMLDKIRGKYEITLEMGRFIAASCGVFVSAVADIKTNKGRNYCIIDGGINHINYYGQTMAMKIPAYTFVRADGTAESGFDMENKKMFAAEEQEKWTICGSLCTVGDVIVKNLPITKPQIGDFLIFHNIGAYSVTEGIYLFLSRRMPVIAAYSKEQGLQIYRGVKAADEINSRQECLL